MPAIKPSLPKGTRDFLPQQMVQRQYVIDTVKTVFERYGYEPLETPSIEKLEVLSGKYGEEGDKLLFKVLRRGTGLEDLQYGSTEFIVKKYSQLVEEALRYDLTVPLSRVVAMHQDKISLPFKRYQIQPVWRAERPQRGRYREFYQCDVDTVGTESMLADAEVIAIVNDVLETLGFEQFIIRINNRKILDGILAHAGIDPKKGPAALIAIDKLDKIGIDGVRSELGKRAIPEDSIKRILRVLEISGAPKEVLSELSSTINKNAVLDEGIDELQQIINYLSDLGTPPKRCKIDLYLARGLGYYTGPIYETVVEEPKIGSLSGGGRYDNLIGMFLGKEIPATGTSFGIERIIDVMSELEMFPTSATKTAVLVTLFDQSTLSASLSFTQELRKIGINAENFLNLAKFKKQLSYANRKEIPFVAIIGPDELAENRVTIKNMRTGEQKTFDRREGVDYLNKQKST
ncbi:MAG: histidine--tRNA ligase [Caldithrix sp.]|nr:MAG: histidine--tRNA ligase [Caldithrix sp.]